MQPVLILVCQAPGLLWVNGRPAGELGADAPVICPVAPVGAVYLQLWPLEQGYLPLTRRITMSGGQVLDTSVADAPGLSVVAWPGGAIEIELTPERVCPDVQPPFSPMDEPGAMALEDGTVRTLESLGDIVGHVRLNGWVRDGGDWVIAYSEMLWEQGGPRWPETPEDTAVAMVEAHLLGLSDEARGYMTPGVAAQRLPESIPQGISACVRMRHRMGDGRDAVGLVRLINDRMARVEPLYYRAVATGGAQGTWRLNDISVKSTHGG